MSRKSDEVLNLSDSFLCPVDEPLKTEMPMVKNEKTCACMTAATTDSETPVYYVVDGLLGRNWHLPAVGNLGWNSAGGGSPRVPSPSFQSCS